MSQHKCVCSAVFGAIWFCNAANLRRAEFRLAHRHTQPLMKEEPRIHERLQPKEFVMDAPSATGAVHRPGRGRVFDSIVDAVVDTPIVRLRKLPQVRL